MHMKVLIPFGHKIFKLHMKVLIPFGLKIFKLHVNFLNIYENFI